MKYIKASALINYFFYNFALLSDQLYSSKCLYLCLHALGVNVWDVLVSASLLTKAEKDQATMRKPVGDFQVEPFTKTKQQRRLVAISTKHSTVKTTQSN